MGGSERILILQTAFIGDVVLTLPLIQVLHQEIPDSTIDVVAIPVAAAVLDNHPAIRRVIVYDKRGRDAGIRGILQLGRRLKEGGYDAAVVPHRSLRSALIPLAGRIPTRIGFSSSAGRFLFTKTVEYRKESHEVARNLSLLTALGIKSVGRPLPSVYPSAADQQRVNKLLIELVPHNRSALEHLVAIAPGSVWNTKRWPEEYFAELVRLLRKNGHPVALIGGPADASLCEEIRRSAGHDGVLSAAGALTLLQSAELIRRAAILVSNDSAPMHLAVAVRTPVVAIFGATVPEFGFAPLGEHDQVLGIDGLSCRPCSIHGGDTCPIKTFDCMQRITARMVFDAILRVTEGSS
jgi:heptosyltransferase-2